MFLLDTPLIGREEELGRLTHALDSLDSHGAAVAVVGEPGIGKTALLTAVAASAAARGMSTIRATGVQSEANLPFSGLGQLLQTASRTIEQLPSSQRTAILGALGKIDVDVGDFFAVALATLSLLRDRAADTPLVVIAEDIQWLDHATVNVLGFVIRRIELDPILVLLSSRSPVELSGLDETVLGRLDLEGIDTHQAGALVDEHAPTLHEDLKKRLVREADGNPLALVELAAAWTRLPPTNLFEHWVPVTTKIEEAFAARLRTLPTRCRTVLLAAALTEAHNVAEALAAASMIESDEVGPAELSLAISAGLVTIEDRRLRFRHPLVQSVVYHAASLSERHEAHAALAIILTDERAIWHRTASTLVPDEGVAQGLEQFADLARRRGTTTEALATLERAAELSPEPGHRGRRLLDAAQLAVQAARPDTAERLLTQAENLKLSDADRARAAWGKQQLRGGTWSDSGRLRAALATIEAISDAGEIEQALDALVALTDAGNLAFDPTMVLATAERLPAPQDDPRLIYVIAFTGPIGYNTTLLEQVRASAARTGQDSAEALRLLGTAATIRGAPELGMSLLGRSVAALQAQGRLSALKQSMVGQASAAFTGGRWDLAVRRASEAMAIAEHTEGDEFGAAFLLGVIAAIRGDTEALSKTGAPLEQRARENGARTMLVLALAIRGHTHLASGQWEEAYDTFRCMIGPRAPHDLIWAQTFLVSLSEAAVHSGHSVEALKILDEAAAMPGSASPVMLASVSYGRALLSDGPEAKKAFSAALSRVPEGSLFDQGRLMLFHGIWLRRQRQPGAARNSLRAARDMFDSLGATPWGDRARQQLRASGEKSPHAAPRPAERLTPQELAIARMAAAGLTNREIGQRLYMSHRTVGAHLYRIFPKLGIISRRELHFIFPE